LSMKSTPLKFFTAISEQSPVKPAADDDDVTKDETSIMANAIPRHISIPRLGLDRKLNIVHHVAFYLL